MVQRTHKYADGGKIVSDHQPQPKPRLSDRKVGRPGFGGAVKDAVEAVIDYTAPRSIKHRKRKTDEAITKAGG